jgi:hypothetical protein
VLCGDSAVAEPAMQEVGRSLSRKGSLNGIPELPKRDLLPELRLIKSGLDDSCHTTASAQALHALAGHVEVVPAARLTFIQRIGEGAFATVDLYQLEAPPPSAAASTHSTGSTRASDFFSDESAKDAESVFSDDTAKKAESVLGIFSRVVRGRAKTYPSGRSSPTTLKPGCVLVIVKHAKTKQTLALNDLAPGERVEVALPPSVSIGLNAEAVLLASLDHANVVRCLGVCEVVDPASKQKSFGIVQDSHQAARCSARSSRASTRQTLPSAGSWTPRRAWTTSTGARPFRSVTATSSPRISSSTATATRWSPT